MKLLIYNINMSQHTLRKRKMAMMLVDSILTLNT